MNKTSKIQPLYVSQAIDELGAIKAQIANLKEQENGIKDSLINMGIHEAEGELFRVTIRETVRRSLDTALIRKLVPKLLLRQAEKESTCTTVRVTARKGILPKAA